VKLSLAQIDPTVGDIRGNLERIRGAYRRAAERGADLVLFPELCVTGYPPRDLLGQPDFIRANLRALERLAKEAGEAGLVVGYAEPNRGRSGRALRNAAALLHKGRVLARRYKTLLPDYDVFDESRYFEPAASNAPFLFKGTRIGLSICEDAWFQAWPSERRIYAKDPVRLQAQAGAELIVNISASPFEKGKPQFRRKLLAAHCAKLRLPLAYCNQAGGNDELIFDGNSFALDSRGALIRQAKAFAEDLVFADPFAKGGARWSEQGDAEQLYQALLLGVRDYAAKCGFRRALVGLSGGIDSAVVCALAADALGPGNVTGVSMPSMYSSKGSVTDAEALARNLGVELRRIPITPVYAAMTKALGREFRGTGLAEQNLQARIRGNILMALSNKTGAILLSTGNKSELSVGYCTLYGDMSGGLAVIADLPKKDVYALARWINRGDERIPRSSIDKPPSAELKPGQKDQDDLPPYDVLDAVVCAYVEEGLDADAIARRGYPPKLVRDILGRVDRSEYKRLQAPPALRVSAKAFGSGWRMPIARGSHRG
jgi:NAD+ synthetase